MGHCPRACRISGVPTAIIGSTAMSEPTCAGVKASGHSPGYDGTAFAMYGGLCSFRPYPCPPSPRTQWKPHSPSACSCTTLANSMYGEPGRSFSTPRRMLSLPQSMRRFASSERVSKAYVHAASPIQPLCVTPMSIDSRSPAFIGCVVIPAAPWTMQSFGLTHA